LKRHASNTKPDRERGFAFSGPGTRGSQCTTDHAQHLLRLKQPTGKMTVKADHKISPPSSRAASHRVHALDALRGIAAMLVLIYHYTYRYNELYGHDFTPPHWLVYGGHGVTLFFMLSGYVITWSISRAKSTRQFITDRFSRLFPTYWAALGLTYFAVYLMGLPGRSVNDRQLVANLSMIQWLFDIKSVDGSYWTLSVEMAFYFWMAIFFSLRLLPKIQWMLPGWQILLAAIAAFSAIKLPLPVSRIFMENQIFLFSAGIFLYQHMHAGSRRSIFLPVAVCLAIHLTKTSIVDLAFQSIIFMALYLAVRGRATILTQRHLLFLGTISFPLYLIHQNVGYIIIRTAYQNGLPGYAGILAALAVSILVAWALHKTIETRVSHLVREQLRRMG